MKNRYLIVFLFIILITSCFNQNIKDDGLYAVIKTSKGKFICKLFYDKTPVTVGNFVGLAEGSIAYKDPKKNTDVKAPFYDGLIFHRVIKDFVIQGGCPLGNGTGGPGYQFVDEFDPALKHDSEGILSMANSGPNTNGSQFFITLKATPFLDGKHTVFGKVVDGMDVVKAIGNVEVDDQDKPYDDIYINKIKIIRKGKDAKAFDAVKAFNLKDQKLKKYLEEKERKSKIFLESLGISDENLITTEIGLKYYIVKKGNGRKPNSGEIAVFHFTGYLDEGTKFSSSYENNTPLEAPVGVGKLLKGIDVSLMDMNQGEKRIIVVPYYLGFGEMGQPPIPPKATIIFEVELLKIKKQ